MVQAYCTVCEEQRGPKGGQLPDTITAERILFELECGHTFNWINGKCYTAEEMKDLVGILSRTINELWYQVKTKKEIAIQALKDIP